MNLLFGTAGDAMSKLKQEILAANVTSGRLIEVPAATEIGRAR
jgi:hypothetical protein